MADRIERDGGRQESSRIRFAPAREFAEDQDSGDLHLLEYLKVIHKRRYTAGTAFLVVVLFVGVYSFTATPVYEATTQLLIEADAPNVVSFKEVIDQSGAQADYYQTQYRLLRSRNLARRTLEAERLWDHPAFGGPAQANQGFSVRRTIANAESAAIGWVKGLFGGGTPDAEPSLAGETVRQSQAIDALLGGLTVTPVRNSRLVDLSYRSPSPGLAAQIVNAVAREYIQQTLEFKFMASKAASDWLGERLAEQRAKVEESEAALQQYRERNDAISLEDRQDIVVQKLAELNTAVTRAKTERIQKEALYNQLRAIQNDRVALDTFPAILTNTFIQQQKAELASLQREEAQLAEKLGDRHPDMVKVRTAIQAADMRLQGEITKVVQSVRNEFLAAESQETTLVRALEEQKREALAMNRKGIEYGVLLREAESNRQIYESLLQRAKETGVSGELRTSNIQIVDQAEVPRAPISPRKRANLMLGLLGGMFLGVGLAFFFEYLDNRIKTPAEIKIHLGLPSIGLIPALHGETTTALINNGVPAKFTEAFRNVRSNVLFSSADEGPRSLVVTSTGPGEGKTMVACNLAVGLAQAGQRVLLIDADMRRPRVHEIFRQPQEPGLSNLMVGNAKASQSVRKTSVRGLWLLPSGKLPPNPAELLGSRRFSDFLGTLGEHFDWVILDTPPVLAVTDPSVVAHAASGVLFVIGAEKTSRQAAQTALEQLEAARARFVGAVLNRVELERNSYYYSQYYRREYTDYYTKTS